MYKLTLLVCLLTLPAVAQEGEAVLISVRGTLKTDGKPITAAEFYLTPANSRTAIELSPNGQFTVKAVSSRTYAVAIYVNGYAPIQRSIEIDAKGAANLGTVTLDTLKTAKLSVVVAPREALKGVAAQQVELRHKGCANVRAQNESGCHLEFCLEQTGPNVTVQSYGYQGNWRTLGKRSLTDAIDGLPKGTYVDSGDGIVTLQPGDVWLSDGRRDPYCGAVIRVDELK